MFFLILPVQIQAEIDVSAERAILMDQTSGRVLFEKDSDTEALIASITKIMTAIVAIEHGDMEEQVDISDQAIGVEGSSIYLEKNDQMTLEDLLYGLMLRSGNDAAVAISEQVAGSQEGFVHLMNQKAEWIGMNHTHFDNPHGLDADRHFSTAYDMALLTKYAMNNEAFRTIFATKSYQASHRDFAWRNKNKLLTSLYENSTGGKTGFTKAAGRTLVSTAEKDGQRLIAVTLNAPDDWQDHISLFEWGFDHYESTLIQEDGVYTFNLGNQIKQGAIKEEVYYPLTDDEKNNVSIKTFFSTDRGNQSFDRVGKKLFLLDDQIIDEVAIYGVSSTSEPKQQHRSYWSQFVQQLNRFVGDIND